MADHKFSSPDQYFGHLSWQMAQSDEYMCGPLAQMNRVSKESLDVAAKLVKDEIQYNFDKLLEMGVNDSVTQIKGLVAHQALLHMERKKVLTGGLQEYEAAADLAAELATWHKLEHERRAVSDQFPKPGHFGYPEHLSMEEYFKLIVEQAEKKGIDMSSLGGDGQPDPNQKGQQGKGKGGGSSQGQGDDEDEQDGQGQEGEDEDEEKEQKGQGGGQGEDEDEKEEKPQQKKKQGPTPAQDLAKKLGSKSAKQYHKQDYTDWNSVSKVQQEAMQASLPDKLESWMKDRGTQPAGLQRLLEELREGVKEKWYEKIANLVGTRVTSTNYRRTIKRPSRRLGIPHAGRVKIPKGLICVGIDTSGSIGTTELTIFIEKLHGIAKAYQAPFEVIICDAEIHTIKRVCQKRDIDSIEIKGGGGTSSLPVFKYLEDKRPDMLVYLTDLYIDFPEKAPPYRVIWGVINREDEPEAPFGETHQLLVEDGDIESPRNVRRRRR